ncbi:hypothetical protein [Halobacillus litoralis]|uniref:hypothetical protein n=1 Tax=Halobacillus TaxID=45667 RepID=UPI0024925803|nr:hypothetical protein [Halobacillus litoralis]
MLDFLILFGVGLTGIIVAVIGCVMIVGRKWQQPDQQQESRIRRLEQEVTALKKEQREDGRSDL